MFQDFQQEPGSAPSNEDLDPDNQLDSKKIFLRKTEYKIENQQVKSSDTEPARPKSSLQSINEFKTGQIYEVVFNHKGRFLNFKEMTEKLNPIQKSKYAESMEIPGQGQEDKNSHVLIHIVKKTVKINNKDHVLIFLRDVTFGVLYE